MKQFTIGKVLKPHGRKGYLKVKVDKDFVNKYLQKKKIKLKKKNEIEKTIEDIKWHKNNLLLKLEDVNDINSAEEYRNYVIVIEEDELDSLENGIYYYYQLKDCKVYIENKYFGKVIDVDNYGSSDILLVKKDENNEEVLIPFIKKIVEKIDVKSKVIKIKKIEGLQI